MASAASIYAPSDATALWELADQRESGRLARIAAALRLLAAIRAAVLAADTDEAAGLWYDLMAASEELRSPFMDALRAAPAPEQDAFLAHLAEFAALRAILDADSVTVAAAGDFKRGKSTAINALLGQAILPTRVAPATAVPCYIRAGAAPLARVFYDDGRPPETIALEHLERYACIRLPGQDDLAFQPAIARIEIAVPWSLPGDVVLLDLPGLNEEEGRSEMATTALARADAILMVLSATQLLAEDELLLLDQLWRQGHRTLLFAINFRDRLEDGEDALVRERAAQLLAPYEGAFGRNIFLISARGAVEAQRAGQPAPNASGLPALDAALRALLTVERRTLWRLSRARQALDALEGEEGETGRAVLDRHAAVRQLRAQLADTQARAEATESAEAARLADAEDAIGACLRRLDEHEQHYRAAWDAVELELQERCRRESLPWVWQLAGEWLRGRLITAIRSVNPEVTPRPEGHLRIRIPPGLRLGRDALFAFYRDEAAREWERFTAAAFQNDQRALEEQHAAAEIAREQSRHEYSTTLATIQEQMARLRAALADAVAALPDTLGPALAAARAGAAAFQFD